MSLPNRFSIFINGRPVAVPQPLGSDDEYVHAQAGNPSAGAPPAIFEAQRGDRGIQLVSGPYALGRYHYEDLSLLPKRVGWCKREAAQMLQPVEVRDEGNGPELSFSGAKLAFIDDKLFAPLLPDMHAGQKIEIRPM